MIEEQLRSQIEMMKSLPQLIAHRGFWQPEKAAQNSLQALQAAQNLAVYGSEFDVRMTADERLVIHHDATFKGRRIIDSDYASLCQRGEAFHKKFACLEHFLKQGKRAASVKLILEIKDLATKEQEEQSLRKVLEVTNSYQMEQQMEYISFSLFVCCRIKMLQPHAAVKYINGDLSPEQVADLGIDGINYHYSVFRKHPEWIAEAHQLGLSVGSWTVNKVHVFKSLAELEIDFVTTDYPDLFQQFGRS